MPSHSSLYHAAVTPAVARRACRFSQTVSCCPRMCKPRRRPDPPRGPASGESCRDPTPPWHHAILSNDHRGPLCGISGTPWQPDHPERARNTPLGSEVSASTSPPGGRPTCPRSSCCMAEPPTPTGGTGSRRDWLAGTGCWPWTFPVTGRARGRVRRATGCETSQPLSWDSQIGWASSGWTSPGTPWGARWRCSWQPGSQRG